MPAYKLYFYPIRALAEVARQIFAYAGVEYEDVRVTNDQWTELRSKTPFDSMPVLEVDGKMIPQSYAIARYLAREYGLAGADAFEAALVDAFADQFKDYLMDFVPYWFALMGYHSKVGSDRGKTPEGLEGMKQEIGIPVRDKFYPLIVKQLKENGSGFLVGAGVTWLDLLVSDHVAPLQDEIPGFMDAYPEVTAHAARIRALPAIAKWIEKRPATRD